jgi:glycine cleavage system H protein
MAKEVSEIILVDGLKYTEDHEWAKKEGDTVKIGITDYAQDQLGAIVFVELPEVDSEFDKGEEFGNVESTKAVSDLIMPIGGKIVAINEALEDDSELVNKDPYGDGWMIEVALSDPAEVEALMDKNAYLELLKGL